MNCHFHPDRVAVEACEICKHPLCGECLWYAESGERLCPTHAEGWQAQGRVVHPPQRYAEGIAFSQVSAANPPRPSVPYQGNSSDLTALVALMLGVSSVLACWGLWYLLPMVAFLLGMVAWLNARNAVNPARTRWLAGGAIATGGSFLLFSFGFIMICMMCYVFAIVASRPLAGFNTPTPFFFPTLTPTP
jgi:hypothetical protein